MNQKASICLVKASSEEVIPFQFLCKAVKHESITGSVINPLLRLPRCSSCIQSLFMTLHLLFEVDKILCLFNGNYRIFGTWKGFFVFFGERTTGLLKMFVTVVIALLLKWWWLVPSLSTSGGAELVTLQCGRGPPLCSIIVIFQAWLRH